MKKLSQDQKNELDKIIIQSDELKRKVRIRVPKNTDLVKSESQKSQKSKHEDKKVYFEDSTKEKKENKRESARKSAKKSVDLGAIGTRQAKKGPSEFRKKSAKWRDGEKVELKDNNLPENDYPGVIADNPTFFENIKSFNVLQWACVGMAAVIFITSIMTTSVYAGYKGEQNKAVAFAELPTYHDMADSELSQVAKEVVEDVEPIVAEEPETVQGSVLSLVLTSVEKDLKIKLIDEDETLVKGVAWGVTLADSSDNQSTYNDDDTDGIIHITDINAGDYSVTINSSDSLNGYTIPSTASQVSVKAKVEYKVIANIRDEIKSEKEVNAAAEDANGNQAADVETGTKLTDTVEWCESTKTENGEQYVVASVDLSKCETAKATLGELVLGAFKKFSDGSNVLNVGNAASIRLVASETPEGGEETAEPEPTPTPTPTPEPTPTPAPEGEPTPTPTPAPEAEPTPTPTPTPTPETPGAVAVTAVKLDQTALSLVVGKSAALKATVEPSNATNKNVTWSSSNSAVASVNGGTVTAVAVGTAKITVTADGGKTATCDVTVTSADKKYKPTSKLFDSSNSPLYKKTGDNYVLATYQDILDGITTFYKKEAGYVYTGWQTIDNQTYYYKSDHTYVTGDQVIGGVLYHFATDGTLTKGSGTLGIDVSKYQPSINWASVKASGVSYVIIRCGYRGASTGALIQDPYFTSHIKGAKAAGLKVGVYFFSTALTEAEAVEEASMCAALCSGYGVNYPVFIDVESSSRPGYNSLPAAQRTANIKAFCNTIRSAGYTPGVYANKTWFTSYINTSQLSGYKIWLAQYNAAGPTYSGRYDLWQYTSKGSVNGIPGNVDMNQSYLGY